MRADNTLSLKNTRFEAPRDLRNRKVQVRFDRLKFDRAVVYFKGECMSRRSGSVAAFERRVLGDASQTD